MAGLFKARSKPFEEGDVEFWHNPERAGWLMKQGEDQTPAKMILLQLSQVVHILNNLMLLALQENTSKPGDAGTAAL